MRKLYPPLLAALLTLVSMTANAWSYDMSDENEVLQSEAYNYRPYKLYNFFGGTYYDGTDMVPMTTEAGEEVKGNGCFTLSVDAASFQLNGFKAYQVQAPVQMNNFYIQIGTDQLNLRAGVNKDGLHNYGSGSRFVALADVKEGQIIVCQWGVTTSRESVVQPSDAISGVTACTWEDITEEIHAVQDANAPEQEEGEEPAVAHDNFTYWRATSDGYFVIELQRDCCIQGLQIWIDASASEAVSSPSLKVVGVDGDSRQLEFKPGESTFGNKVVTYYSTDGEDPVFLKDSEEVDYYDYVYQTDEEGNIVLDEEGNPVVVEEIPVYKKVLDESQFVTDDETGQVFFGPNAPFNVEDGYIYVDASDDEEDGNPDGKVTVKAVSVSESTCVISDIQVIEVSVGEIQLNAPTLTLVGIDGKERIYKMTWNNNTLCGEPYKFIYENGEDLFQDYDWDEETNSNPAFTELISSESSVKVTVQVEGYLDGVVEQAVMDAGVDYHRVNTEVEHDWDFVNPSDEIKMLLKGEAVERYYIENAETGEKTYYTVEEFANGEDAEGNDISEAIPEYKVSGWTWNGSAGRATLDVIIETDEETGDVLSVKYAEDAAHVWGENGLTISCPPNAKNNSTIMHYVDKNNLGLAFMVKPTLTFDRSVFKPGQLVVFTVGEGGGSNYINGITQIVDTCPSEALYTVTLPTLSGGFCHLLSIDIYTQDELPEDSYIVGVEDIKTPVAKTGVRYNLAGQKVDASYKGIVIIDGKAVLVK